MPIIYLNEADLDLVGEIGYCMLYNVIDVDININVC